MIRLIQLAGLISLFLSVLTGCATNIGLPQTRSEFVKMYKPGGLFRSAEHVTVNRPVKAVVADTTEYANKCLKVRITNRPNYQYKEVGGTTTYIPKIGAGQNGMTTLSVQEKYNDRDESGVPPGGMFSLVAEIRAAGSNKTQVDIYHAGRGKIADFLKLWIEGNKDRCPSLERGW